MEDAFNRFKNWWRGISSAASVRPPASMPLISSHATTTPLLGHPKLNNAAYWKATADPSPRLVIVSGAGLSHESGLALFRGQGGLWGDHRIEEVCNGHVWRLFREKVEAFYEHRLQDAQLARPNPGHAWCAAREHEGAVLLTQNVDDLLERAGAMHVGHLHGRLDHRRCFTCDFRWARTQSRLEDEQVCPSCRGTDTRVDVVLFHEQAEAYQSAHRVLAGLRTQDVLLIVGTTGTVFNPIPFLTEKAQVWVADTDPSRELLSYPGVRVFTTPASALETSVGVAWEKYRREQAN